MRLNDQMVDLDQSLTISGSGKPVFAGTVPRTIAVIATTLAEYGDPRSVFCGEVGIDLPQSQDDP